MNFAVSESQRLFSDTLGRLFKQEGFEARRARLSRTPPDRMALWSALVGNGVLGAFLPEEAGGFGGAARDMAVIFYEIGRALAVEPVLGALMASRILLAARDEGRSLIDALIAGEQTFAFAHAEGHDPFAAPAVRAERMADGGWALAGMKPVVRHADVASRIIVTALTDAGTGCYLVESGAAGLTCEPFRLIDGSGAGRLQLNGVRSVQLIAPGDAGPVIAEAIEWGLAALAAETVGIVDALNAQTQEYLRVRRQFGVPLASFQALQHRAADMHIAGEEVGVAVDMQIDALDGASSQPEQPARWSAIKILADKAGRRIGHEAIQLHGGMGVSDELIVSHYARRLAAIRAELGGDAVHRERIRVSGGSSLMLEEAEDVRAFRQEVRDFIAASCPADLRRKAAFGLALEKEDYVRWERILREKGWYAAAWPIEHGGAAWNLGKQLTFVQEAALNDAPQIMPYGVNMLGPVIYSFGTPEQRARYLPGILNSQTWWCQGYSEPNAGSDLASLKTFAERDGDHYVINGTKMWTTEAQWADMMHCLVRTRRDGRPQEGITFILIDMNTPGISIQPIITLDGQHHTNQTFFDNVRVPVENVVAGEGQGWKLAKFLLGNERIAIADTGAKLRLLQHIETMHDELKAAGTAPDHVLSSLGNRLVDLDIELAVLVMMERRYVDMWEAGGSRNGPEASLLKIRGTEILQGLTELALEIEGPWAAVHDPADLHKPSDSAFGAAERASFMGNHYLYSRCWSIFGGTNEIQRNIIAKTIGLG